MLELITDRTQQDVDRVNELLRKGLWNMTIAERQEWLQDEHKGAYNYTDLNRVENAVSNLAQRLVKTGHNVSIQPVREWMNTDLPTQSDMERYLANIKALRDCGVVLPANTPEVPATMNGLTYDGANAIEQILANIDYVLGFME